jgi:hypothetical protein
MEMSKEMRKALNSGKVSKVFTAMINSTEDGGEIKMIENYEFFANNLLKDLDFVMALKDARKRDVDINLLLSPIDPKSIEKYKRRTLGNHLFGAYEYGGVENVKNYLMSAIKIDDEPIKEEEAYKLAKSFEEDVMGDKKYLIKTKGLIGRVLGKVEKVTPVF